MGGGVSALPADHSGRTDDSCLMCHQAQPAAAAGEATPAQAAPASCMDCHSNDDLTMKLASGETLDLFVDGEQMAQSVHAGKLECVDCHSNITGYPHQKVEAADRRDYSIALYEACKRCHFANYTKTLDSMHFQAMEAGNKNAPLCTDCHGYHNVSVPDQPRSSISKSCASCHADTYKTYSESVHGAALLKDENQDVPVCTDCHGAHSVVQDPTAAAFRLGLARDVRGLPRRRGADGQVRPIAQRVQDLHAGLPRDNGDPDQEGRRRCRDRQGGLLSTATASTTSSRSRPGARRSVKQQVLANCQKCHPDAGSNFPDCVDGPLRAELAEHAAPVAGQSFLHPSDTVHDRRPGAAYRSRSVAYRKEPVRGGGSR